MHQLKDPWQLYGDFWRLNVVLQINFMKYFSKFIHAAFPTQEIVISMVSYQNMTSRLAKLHQSNFNVDQIGWILNSVLIFFIT